MGETPSALHLFEKLRDALTHVLGSAATAALIRRAAKRAMENAPDPTALEGLEVILEGFDYRYELPPAWHQEGSEAALRAFRYVVEEHLRPIVLDLTGLVGARLLDPICELARHATVAPEPPAR